MGIQYSTQTHYPHTTTESSPTTTPIDEPVVVDGDGGDGWTPDVVMERDEEKGTCEGDRDTENGEDGGVSTTDTDTDTERDTEKDVGTTSNDDDDSDGDGNEDNVPSSSSPPHPLTRTRPSLTDLFRAEHHVLVNPRSSLAQRITWTHSPKVTRRWGCLVDWDDVRDDWVCLETGAVCGCREVRLPRLTPDLRSIHRLNAAARTCFAPRPPASPPLLALSASAPALTSLVASVETVGDTCDTTDVENQPSTIPRSSSSPSLSPSVSPSLSPSVPPPSTRTTFPTTSPLESIVDLRPYCPPVVDDVTVGCSAVSAIACLHDYWMMHRQPFTRFSPVSRLFGYYVARDASGPPGATRLDGGCTLRQALHSLRTTGWCAETEHPFHPARVHSAPTLDAYDNAWVYPLVRYARVEPNVDAFRRVLSAHYPIACALPVCASVVTDTVALTGEWPLPTSKDVFQGGHAVVVVGYDDARERFIVRNSWGRGWGEEGYGYIGYGWMGRVTMGWVVMEGMDKDE